jgi:hypothetical protein
MIRAMPGFATVPRIESKKIKPTLVFAGRLWLASLVAWVVHDGQMTQKCQCHARESSHPDLAKPAGGSGSRFREWHKPNFEW